MKRRDFMAAGITAGLSAAEPIPIIDTHIHLFDTTRPQGVPWPPKENTRLYQPALPPRYRKLAEPLGVVGAIEVEASPWLEDNQWVLDVAAGDKIVVGTVGNLEPGKPEFAKQLERFHRNPLFRGIRCGNLWGRKLEPWDDLKLLAKADLSMDTANPTPELMSAVVRASDRVPELRIVIDHLPGMKITDAVRPTLRELGKRPQIFVKLSALPRDPEMRKSNLDELCEIFGEDRVMFGSDWPNSDNLRPIEEVVGLVRDYFNSKPRSVQEKYFWRNSVKAYKWVKRDASQPHA